MPVVTGEEWCLTLNVRIGPWWLFFDLKICRSLKCFWVGFTAGGNGAKVELCWVLLGFKRGIGWVLLHE